MQTLFDLLTDFYSNIFNDFNTYDYMNYIHFNIGSHYTDGVATPYYLSMADWLIYTCSLISTIVIVVLCCLFVYKIIKLIGGLIR